MRINKLFSNLGICSRKETNRLIEGNRIKVNNKLCVLGQWVDPDKDEILMDDKSIFEKQKVYIALNKPKGIECTGSTKVDNNIINFINYPDYIFPIGRLDKDSEGLILMTNDGDLANEVLNSENSHEKEYIVRVNKPFEENFIEKMSKGIEINVLKTSGIKRISDTYGIDENNNKVLLEQIKEKHRHNEIKNKTITKACKVNKINQDTFSIILTQGLNRQIRKMCGSLGYKVIRLQRVRIMNIQLESLEYGKWRYITREEICELKINLQN